MMKEFQPTEESYIKRLIDEETRQPELGTVTEIFERTQSSDNNFKANVKLRDSDKERRKVHVAAPFNGAISIPEIGDTVIVDFLDGEGQEPVVVGKLHNAEDKAPLGTAGVYRLRKGDLYFEMDPNGNWVRLAKKPTDDGTPDAKVEIDSTGDVDITGHKETATDHPVASGDGATTVFTLSHSLGKTPSTAHVQPTSGDAAGQHYVSNKTSTDVEITYLSAPTSGTDNLTYDLTTTE